MRGLEGALLALGAIGKHTFRVTGKQTLRVTGKEDSYGLGLGLEMDTQTPGHPDTRIPGYLDTLGHLDIYTRRLPSDLYSSPTIARQTEGESKSEPSGDHQTKIPTLPADHYSSPTTLRQTRRRVKIRAQWRPPNQNPNASSRLL